MHRLALALLTTCLLCGCGQKGNLSLPDGNRDEVRAAASATATAPAATPNAPADSTTTDERERANAADNPRSN